MFTKPGPKYPLHMLAAPSKEKVAAMLQIILQALNLGLAVLIYGVSSEGDKFFLIVSLGSLVQLLACMPIERLVPNATIIAGTSKAPVELYLLFLFLVCNLIIIIIMLVAGMWALLMPGSESFNFSYSEILTTVIYGMTLTNLMIRGGIHQYRKRFFIATTTSIISPFAIFIFLTVDSITAKLGPAGVLFWSSALSLVIVFFYPKRLILPSTLSRLKDHYPMFAKSVVSSSYLKLSHAVYHFSVTWFVTLLGLAAAEGSVLLLNISKRAAEAVTQVAVAPSTRRLLVHVSQLSQPRLEVAEFGRKFCETTIKSFVFLGVLAAVILLGYVYFQEGSVNAQVVGLYFTSFILCQFLILIETPFSTINNVNNNVSIFLFANILFAVGLVLLEKYTQSVTVALFGILLPQIIVLLLHYFTATGTNKCSSL